MTTLFMSVKHTGYHKGTTLINLGIVSSVKKRLYVELSDFDTHYVYSNQIMSKECRKTINELTLDNTLSHNSMIKKGDLTEIYGNTFYVSFEIEKWLKQFNFVEIVMDRITYDWIVFLQLWPEMGYPKNVYPVPIDLHNIFPMKGVNNDINRIEFSNFKQDPFNSQRVIDAKIIKKCYEKLMSK